jgi:hypothetical protein
VFACRAATVDAHPILRLFAGAQPKRAGFLFMLSGGKFRGDLAFVKKLLILSGYHSDNNDNDDNN